MSEWIPFSFAKKTGLLVTTQNSRLKVLYCQQPASVHLLELRRHLNQPFELEQVSPELFNQQFIKSYQTDTHTAIQIAEDFGETLNIAELIQELPKTEDLLEKQDEAPIIRLLNALLHEALKAQASDLHVETFEDRVCIRFRIDGLLREIIQPPRILAPLLISRIKVMAKLDIAEKRLPQDGRMSIRVGEHTVDIRVSTMPTSHGERVVLRLLDKQQAQLDLAELGMGAATLKNMQQLIQRPHGIILFTGPTGSGKTTSLYAILSALNDRKRNILTIEDPIEYDLPGIGQTQVNAKINMTFAKGLRAILRQDPDVVMIGEIRDLETARIAIQASLTGHLVLSTLHTNSTVGAITRLTDMGIESFLLSSSLIGVVAQRLIRLLCTACKQAHAASEPERRLLKVTDPLILYHPQGCEHCQYTGYKGRSGIYELVEIDEKLAAFIHGNQAEAVLRDYARQHSPSLQEDGFVHVRSGETSVEEIIRVTSEE